MKGTLERAAADGGNAERDWKDAHASDATPSRARLRVAGRWCAIALVLLACVARIVHLDADPYMPTWTQYVVDEGRWNEVARNFALFNWSERTRIGQVHLILSPGYQAVNFVLFKAFGVSFWSARLLAAVCGIAIVVAVYFAVRRHVTLFACLLGMLIIGFESGLLAESRLALPEVPSLLGILLSFLLLVFGRNTARNACLAGVLAIGAIGMKATSMLVVPVLPLVILFLPESGTLRERVIRLLWFGAGFVVPALGGIVVAYALGLLDEQALSGPGRRIVGFLSIADPRFVVWRFFNSTQLEIRNLLLLGAWFTSWLWAYRSPSVPRATRNLYLMSGLWAAWWLVLWSINDYSPGRYVVHFVVPATIHVMAGLSLGNRDSLVRAAGAMSRPGDLALWLRLVWLILPSAILLAPLVTATAERAGVDLSRASDRVTAIALLTLILAASLRRRVSRSTLIAELLAFPILLTLFWMAGRELGLWLHFWTFETTASLSQWAGLVAVAAIAAFLIAPLPRPAESYLAMEWVVIVALAAVLLREAAVPLLAPTYSMRDASREIGRRLAEAKQIRIVSASAMFLDNKLRYRELSRTETGYDAMVLYEHNQGSQQYLRSEPAAGFRRVAEFPIVIHPRYEFDPAIGGPSRVAVLVPK